MGSVGPETSPELAQLDEVIHAALQAVLTEAKARGVTSPPYGRAALQLPYDDYTAAPAEDEDDDGDDDFDDEPPFKFDYGFNPLRFVAQYLRDHNPHGANAHASRKDDGAAEAPPQTEAIDAAAPAAAA